MPWAAIIPALIGAGSSVAGSFLSGQPKTQTSTTNQNSTQSQNQWSTATPTFSPELQQLMAQLMAYSAQDPQKALQPVRQAGLQQINQAYSNVPGQVTQQMARRGYGSSGAMGDQLYQTALGRAGAVSGFEGGLANSAIQQGQFGASLGQQLLNTGKGISSAGDAYGQGWQAGTSTGTGPDTSLSSGLMSGGNALSNLSTLLMLQKVLSSGGGSLNTPTVRV